MADLAFENDIEALIELRRFIDFLPASNREKPPVLPTADPYDRPEPSLDTLVPESPNQPYDMMELIRKIVDEGDFFEIAPAFARNIVTGFGRMEGGTIGIVREGDMIDIDIPNRTISLRVDEAVLAERRAEQNALGWKPAALRKRNVTTALKAYAAFATSADRGAVRDLNAYSK